MITTNYNIVNGFKRRNGKTDIGHGFTMRFCDNLAEKVNVETFLCLTVK